MSVLFELLKTTLTALNPYKYDELVDRKKRHALQYFVMLLLLVFILTAILFIPTLTLLPSYMQEEFSKFTKLSVTLDYEQTEPIKVPKVHPVITIDTVNPRESIEEGYILISKGSVFYRFTGFTKGTMISTDDLLSASGFSKILTSIFIMLAPMLIVMLYLFHAVKYLIVIFAVSAIGFIFSRVVRFGIEFYDCIKVGMYASTPMILLGLLTKPFVPSVGYLEYLVFLAYFIVGVFKVGDFEEVVKAGKGKSGHGRYTGSEADKLEKY